MFANITSKNKNTGIAARMIMIVLTMLPSPILGLTKRPILEMNPNENNNKNAKFSNIKKSTKVKNIERINNPIVENSKLKMPNAIKYPMMDSPYLDFDYQ